MKRPRDKYEYFDVTGDQLRVIYTRVDFLLDRGEFGLKMPMDTLAHAYMLGLQDAVEFAHLARETPSKGGKK